MSDLTDKTFATKAVHAGERKTLGLFTPVATPLHASVGYVYETMGELDRVFAGEQSGYVYPRFGSPTVAAFEEAMAVLEGGQAAQAFASGMAAIHATLLAAGARPGSTVIAAIDVYGATYTLLQQHFDEQGVQVVWVDVSDHSAVEAAMKSSSNLAILLVETISNPLLKVADIPQLAELAHRHGALLLVDNTFATPYLVNPMVLGADYSLHSATKYIGGHGDLMAGVVVTSQEKRQKLLELNKLVGGVLGPFEAWLALRGIKTLELRMRQQCASAARVGDWLNMHPAIAQVNYPGLLKHPQHTLARRLFGSKGYGGMLSFEIRGADQESAFSFMDALKLCQPATTLGDVYSLVLHPATSSHRTLSGEERARVGISDGLVRLSVGIEDPEDIVADLNQALESVATRKVSRR